MCNGAFNAGWFDAADKQAPDIANIRTSISTRRSAFTPCRVTEPTCQARRHDDAGESRMRGICMSGLTSGVWRRSQGRTNEAPPNERGGNSYVGPTATAPHLDSTAGSGRQMADRDSHPEFVGQDLQFALPQTH